MFRFTRIARNASYSDRTAKIGKAVDSLRAAVEQAAALSKAGHGEITLTDDQGQTGKVRCVTLGTPQGPARVMLELPPEWLAQMVEG